MPGLNGAEQVVIGSAGDLPGRKVQDLLDILDLIRDHNVGLYTHRERINVDDGASAILDLIAAYRDAKVAQSIGPVNRRRGPLESGSVVQRCRSVCGSALWPISPMAPGSGP